MKTKSRINSLLRWLLRGILVLAFMGFVTLFTFHTLINTASAQDERVQADAILMLGAGVDSAGEPSPALVARVEHTLALYQAGYAPLIALTGGPVVYEHPEALVAYEMLLDAGVPEDAILFESQSLTTSENILYITPLLKERSIHTVLLVTSPFHVWRATQIAEDAGFTVHPSPAPNDPAETRPAYRFWYVTRESGAWVLYELFGM